MDRAGVTDAGKLVDFSGRRGNTSFFFGQQLRVSGGHLKRRESKVFTDSYFGKYKVPFFFGGGGR